VKRILVLMALLGFGIVSYVLLRPAPSQVIRLERVTPLPSQLEQPVPEIQAVNTPVSTVKPRPTQPIEPRRTPIIKAPPREVKKTELTRETPEPTPEPEKPLVTRDAAKPEPTRDETVKEIETQPSLTVRQDAGSWRVQAGAFRTQSNAEAMQTKIQKGGLTAQVVQGEDGIYRVLVGNYSTSDAARADSGKVSSTIR
jgi:rare lipoprotein A